MLYFDEPAGSGAAILVWSFLSLSLTIMYRQTLYVNTNAEQESTMHRLC